MVYVVSELNSIISSCYPKKEIFIIRRLLCFKAVVIRVILLLILAPLMYSERQMVHQLLYLKCVRSEIRIDRISQMGTPSPFQQLNRSRESDSVAYRLAEYLLWRGGETYN